MFKIGDTVSLKSGGPLMTVRLIKSDDEIICEWFLDNEKYSAHFHPDTLIADDGMPPIPFSR